MRRGPGSAVALGVYALAAFLIFGLRVALRSGGETYVGAGADPADLHLVDFAWWPHAILHGENPFVTHAIWAPDGCQPRLGDARPRPRAALRAA